MYKVMSVVEEMEWMSAVASGGAFSADPECRTIDGCLEKPVCAVIRYIGFGSPLCWAI